MRTIQNGKCSVFSFSTPPPELWAAEGILTIVCLPESDLGRHWARGTGRRSFMTYPQLIFPLNHIDTQQLCALCLILSWNTCHKDQMTELVGILMWQNNLVVVNEQASSSGLTRQL